jgi:hypothetical protein
LAYSSGRRIRQHPHRPAPGACAAQEQVVSSLAIQTVLPCERFGFIPTLPPEWENQDGLILKPEMLDPARLQFEPFPTGGPSPLHGKVSFNTLCPYFRPPWLSAIVGCDLSVSATAQVVWPQPTITSDWYEREDLGLMPRLEWLDKLLEFTRYIIDHWHPDQCIPCPDMIGRGPGDLLNGLFGPEQFYLAMYEHPEELKRLIDKVADIYIMWARAQFAILPKFHGGGCNLYGIWSPADCIRFQEDYAINISGEFFREFLLPASRRIMQTFPYQIFHTHSGFPDLVDWLMEIEELKGVDVCLDPQGKPVVRLLPQWRRLLERKCLILAGAMTQAQLDLILSELPAGGLCVLARGSSGIFRVDFV